MFPWDCLVWPVNCNYSAGYLIRSIVYHLKAKSKNISIVDGIRCFEVYTPYLTKCYKCAMWSINIILVFPAIVKQGSIHSFLTAHTVLSNQGQNVAAIFITLKSKDLQILFRKTDYLGVNFWISYIMMSWCHDDSLNGRMFRNIEKFKRLTCKCWNLNEYSRIKDNVKKENTWPWQQYLYTKKNSKAYSIFVCIIHRVSAKPPTLPQKLWRSVNL